MSSITQELVLHAWHRKNMLFYLVLVPLSWLFGGLISLRRWLYQRNILKSHALAAPVVVVGNIQLGGTGKTPVVIWLVEQLKARGFKPGVISRGYGANVKTPLSVNSTSQASEVGDEPLLIAKRCTCPVFVCADRVAAGEALLNAHPDCNVIVSDDGMQHYRLQRSVEIALVNGDVAKHTHLLPAGPMREPLKRLTQVDALVLNDSADDSQNMPENAYKMQLVGAQFYNLQNPQLTASATEFKHKSIKAMAGIGKPERFFAHLRQLGLNFAGISFDDHHAFSASDLLKIDCDILIMTEKDAVKCAKYAQPQHWVLPVNAQIDEALLNIVLPKITIMPLTQTSES